MKYKTCCFTGHRMLPEDKIDKIKERLMQIIEDMVKKKDVLFFCTGGAMGFDTVAAECVLEAKKIHTDIKLILVLPHINQDKYYPAEYVRRYAEIKNSADRIIYTSHEYYRGCMHERNRYMVDHSDYCVCYLTEHRGGTAYTVRYAEEKRMEVIYCAQGL